MTCEQQKAVEMTGYGKRGKPKAGFPIVSHSPWKSQTTRFPHSHSPGEARKSGKPNPGFPLSRLLFYFSRKGDPAIASLRLRLILRLEYAGDTQLSSICMQRSDKPERIADPPST